MKFKFIVLIVFVSIFTGCSPHFGGGIGISKGNITTHLYKDTNDTQIHGSVGVYYQSKSN